MNSSFPNRWSFSYLKFTKCVTNIIAEPKYKNRHQEQVTVRNHNRSRSFVSAKKHIAEQANKASFALMRKIRNLDLPIDIIIDLFNKNVKPILLYGCELWGITLNLKKSRPWNMIYGELGVAPLYIDVQSRIISFWTKLVDSPIENKLSSKVYRLFTKCMLLMHRPG